MPAVYPALRPALQPALQSALGAMRRRGGGSLPAAPFALWYIDQYTTTPKAHIPISAEGRAAPVNLLTAPRRLFNNVSLNLWSPRTSFADSGESAPDGTNDASVLTGAGNFSAGTNGAVALAAGTYTIAMRAKRGIGSDQSFQMQFNTSPVSTSATKVATDTWQWFTHHATRAAGSHLIVHAKSADGVTGATLHTMDWMLLPGTVTDDADLNAAAAASLQGDMYLSAGVPYASGELDLALAGRSGIAQFSTTRTLTTFTAFALVSKTVAGPAFQPILSKPQLYTDFGAMLQVSGAAEGYFGGQSLGVSKRQISLTDQGYHMITLRYDGTTLSYWIDDVRLDNKVVSAPSKTVQDIMIGLLSAGSLYLGGKLAGVVGLYDRGLTDAEIRTAYKVQKARASASGITATRARFLAADGDSITEAAAGYFYKFLPNSNPVVQGRNFAVSGAGLAEVQSRAAAVDAMLPPNPEAGKFVLTLFVGANLPVGSDLAQFLTDYAAYCDARRAAGWVVAVATILPRNDDAFNVRRATINAAIVTWAGVHCDAVINFAADPDMGTDAASNSGGYDATYYYDGVHPTDAGHVRLETIYRPVVNGLYT